MSRSEGMCARLKVPVSSRHNGPAFIAVRTKSMADKAVPISAAEVSIPDFAIRFTDMRLEIERRNCCPSIIKFGVSIAERKYRGEDCCVTYSTRIRSAGSPAHTVLRITPKRRLSAHWRQPGGMQTVIFIADSTKNTYTLPG